MCLMKRVRDVLLDIESNRDTVQLDIRNGKGHIVNSATVLSSIIGMGDLLQLYQQLQVQGGNTVGWMGENYLERL